MHRSDCPFTPSGDMKRFFFVAGAALTLAGCSKSPAPPADQASDRPFGSDRISVVTRGSGPDIVLVPGLDSHRDVWDGLADSLEGRYRLHLVQVNGFAGLAPGANANRKSTRLNSSHSQISYAVFCL